MGGALLQQIRRQQAVLSKQGIGLRVVGLANSRKMVLSKTVWIWLTGKRRWKNPQNVSIWLAVKQLVDDSHLINPVIVDCTSDETISGQYADFLAAGFHVVTPNKKPTPVLSSTTANCVVLLRRNYRRKFLYETNVGAGLPVIENLQNLIKAGDRLQAFNGILSGLTVVYLR